MKNFIEKSWKWLLLTGAIAVTGFWDIDPNVQLAVLPAIVAAGTLLAPIIGGVIGSITSGPERAKAEAAANRAFDIINSMNLSPDESIPLLLQEFKADGVLTPEFEEAILQESSKMSEVGEDPALRNAQMGALEMLGDRAKVGLGAEERAAFNKVRMEVARDSEAKRQQIIQSMQQRGQAGSGAELAAQLSTAQAGDQRASEEGDRIAASAAASALDAMSRYGTQAGQIRETDFGVNSSRAKAADEMQRFNVTSQQGVQQRNVTSQNVANQANTERGWQVSDRNVAQANAEALRQSEARRAKWQDDLTRAKVISGASGQQADTANKAADNTAENWQKIGSGVGAGAGGLYNKVLQDEQDAEEKKKSDYVGPYSPEWYSGYNAGRK